MTPLTNLVARYTTLSGEARRAYCTFLRTVMPVDSQVHKTGVLTLKTEVKKSQLSSTLSTV